MFKPISKWLSEGFSFPYILPTYLGTRDFKALYTFHTKADLGWCPHSREIPTRNLELVPSESSPQSFLSSTSQDVTRPRYDSIRKTLKRDCQVQNGFSLPYS